MKKRISYLPTLLVAFALLLGGALFTACSSEGKVGEANLLYGDSSKKWELDKETTAGGDKVAQDEDNQTFTFYSNGQYNMATAAEAMTGKFRFDQPGKKLTLISESGMESAFTVTTLTDDHLTLTAPDGSAIKLKSE